MRRGLYGLCLVLLCFSVRADKVEKGAEDVVGPKKNGAGLLFISPSGHVLLLLRAGRHNTGKWGLPGGNVEPGESDLLATAKREAAEELGGAASLPSYVIAGQPILIKRGHKGKKHFTVFVAKVSEATKSTYAAPNLNAKEHSDYRWFSLDDLARLAAEGKLHPVVKKLLSHHKDEILKVSGAKPQAAKTGGAGKAP